VTVGSAVLQRLLRERRTALVEACQYRADAQHLAAEGEDLAYALARYRWRVDGGAACDRSDAHRRDGAVPPR
jgi:hypothetical protein